MTAQEIKPSIFTWIKAMTISGFLSPLFSPFMWILLFISIKASSNVSEFLPGLFLAFNISLGIAWPVIISSLFFFTAITFRNFSYWSTSTKRAWFLLGALVSAVMLFIALAIIGGLRHFANDFFIILEIFLNFIPAGAISALVFRRILLNNAKLSK